MLLWPERGVRYCGMECGRCIVWGFEWLELTHAFAVSHVCDCGVIWRLMVLGVEPLRTGARVFCGEGRRGERDVGWAGL